MKNSYSNHNSFHTDRDRERDGDGGGFYSTTHSHSHATGSPPTNISSPTSSFYNLQMYSTPSLYATPAPTTTTATTYQSPQPLQPQTSSFNLYQSVQEVPYHPPLDHRPYPVRSSPSPSVASTTGSSSSSGLEFKQVHKNGITFVDPFSAPVSTTSNTDNYYIQQQQQQYQRNHGNIRSTTATTSSSVRANSEPVFQPIYATFGTESIFVTCPYCHNTDSTEIEQVIGSEAMIWACIIPFAGFLRKSKWDTRHRCKNCLNVIGTYYP